MSQRLTRTKGRAVLGFQNHLLIEKKFLQFHVRRELEAQWPNDFFEEVLQSLLS